jgi:hypothetical protein
MAKGTLVRHFVSKAVRQWQNDRMATGTLVLHFSSAAVAVRQDDKGNASPSFWQHGKVAEGTLVRHFGSISVLQDERMAEGTLVRHFGSMAAGAVSKVESGPNLPSRGASLQRTNKGPLKYTYIFTYFHIQILC